MQYLDSLIGPLTYRTAVSISIETNNALKDLSGLPFVKILCGIYSSLLMYIDVRCGFSVNVQS